MTAVLERTATAPATIANIGPGFDILGLALRGPADRVTARRTERNDVRIVCIDGHAAGLPTDSSTNTAGVAATHTRRAAGLEDVGVDLLIHKGIPLESGMGSSAASAAAAAFAVNQLLGSPLRTQDLIGPCVEAETVVSGRHADNVAPALLGGLVMAHECAGRFQVHRLPAPRELLVVVVTPNARVATRDARRVIPDSIPFAARTRNAANIAGLVSACYSGDLALLARCIEDDVVLGSRLPLIPGAAGAIDAANAAGALGASISGAGPSLFALCHSAIAAQAVSSAMTDAFLTAGVQSSALVSPADNPGARLIRSRGVDT